MRALLAVEAAQRSQLHAALIQRGWRIASVASAAEGITRFSSEAFQLVVVSSQLPDSDGVSLCRAIRSASHGRDAYLLMVQPTTVPEGVRRLVEAGVDDVVTTPLGPSNLVMRLALAEFRLADKLMDPPPEIGAPAAHAGSHSAARKAPLPLAAAAR